MAGFQMSTEAEADEVRLLYTQMIEKSHSVRSHATVTDRTISDRRPSLTSTIRRDYKVVLSKQREVVRPRLRGAEASVKEHDWWA